MTMSMRVRERERENQVASGYEENQEERLSQNLYHGQHSFTNLKQNGKERWERPQLCTKMWTVKSLSYTAKKGEGEFVMHG